MRSVSAASSSSSAPSRDSNTSALESITTGPAGLPAVDTIETRRIGAAATRRVGRDLAAGVEANEHARQVARLEDEVVELAPHDRGVLLTHAAAGEESDQE